MIQRLFEFASCTPQFPPCSPCPPRLKMRFAVLPLQAGSESQVFYPQMNADLRRYRLRSRRVPAFPINPSQSKQACAAAIKSHSHEASVGLTPIPVATLSVRPEQHYSNVEL